VSNVDKKRLIDVIYSEYEKRFIATNYVIQMS